MIDDMEKDDSRNRKEESFFSTLTH